MGLQGSAVLQRFVRGKQSLAIDIDILTATMVREFFAYLKLARHPFLPLTRR